VPLPENGVPGNNEPKLLIIVTFEELENEQIILAAAKLAVVNA
jgi:hypothetical protein